MSCGCYESTIKSCSATIVLKAGLTPATSYYWLIENKFGKIYQRQAVTDGAGALTIDLSVLPDGATNEFSGHYRLSIRDGSNYLTKIQLTLQGKPYDCVLFNFAAIDDTNAHNVIQ